MISGSDLLSLKLGTIFYFTPRRQRGKQDKWRRKFAGPYLVVGVPGPVNVTLQLNAKAKPFLAHIDKVKSYCADVMPKSWLTTGTSTAAEPVSNAEIDTQGGTTPDEVHALSFEEPGEVEHGEIVPEWPPPVQYRSPRPQRMRQVPARYRD